MFCVAVLGGATQALAAPQFALALLARSKTVSLVSVWRVIHCSKNHKEIINSPPPAGENFVVGLTGSL